MSDFIKFCNYAEDSSINFLHCLFSSRIFSKFLTFFCNKHLDSVVNLFAIQVLKKNIDINYVRISYIVFTSEKII